MRILPALALSAGLMLGGCQYPDGTTDWGSTAALGIGTAAVVGLAVAASNNRYDDDRYYRNRYYDRRYYGGYQNRRYHGQRRYYSDRRYSRAYW